MFAGSISRLRLCSDRNPRPLTDSQNPSSSPDPSGKVLLPESNPQLRCSQGAGIHSGNAEATALLNLRRRPGPMGATAQGEGLRGHAAAPGGSTGRGRAAWAGQPLSAAPCRVCSTRGPRLLPQWTRDRQPAHSLLRGQRCRASRRARVTRSTFSRVALPPIRPMRSTWGQGGGRRSPRVGAWLPRLRLAQNRLASPSAGGGAEGALV